MLPYQQQYQEAFEAGLRYGKDYRKKYRSWSSDRVVARRAADAVFTTHDYSGFFYGVLKGLESFSSDQFAATFEHNAKHAMYRAEATIQGIHLSVATRDKAHYQATLASWKQVGATILRQTS